jgi:hypothetical protein
MGSASRRTKRGREAARKSLSFAKILSAFDFNKMGRCFAQAIRDTSNPCSASWESFSSHFFAFSAGAGASCSKTWFFFSSNSLS